MERVILIELFEFYDRGGDPFRGLVTFVKFLHVFVVPWYLVSVLESGCRSERPQLGLVSHSDELAVTFRNSFEAFPPS